jgi:hypothetical protein
MKELHSGVGAAGDRQDIQVTVSAAGFQIKDG